VGKWGSEGITGIEIAPGSHGPPQKCPLWWGSGPPSNAWFFDPCESASASVPHLD